MIPAGNELARAAWAQLWQVTLLIAAVALLARLFARNRPHLAHVLWLVVLLKCVTPPLWSSPSGVFCWMQAMPRGGPAEAMPLACVGSEEHLPFHVPAVALSGDEESIPFTANEPSELGTILSTASPSQRAQPADQGLQGHRSGPNGRAWTGAALVGAWILGTLGILSFAVWRWARCVRLIREARCATGDSHHVLMARLSRRLGLRRPARLVVTASRVGPAVMGLVRPTVLLPEAILLGKNDEDLEPLLAHELIHVRRGDLWVGSLQVLAQAVWWFHPLVWWAGQRTSREAERCCDEALIAELGCTPGRYARALLDVLERRRILQPLPALPGVRPVEVTSRRLERIMKLGQGSRKRSPWWCWVVMLALAMLTLPGAALVVAAGDGHEAAAPSGDDASAPLRLLPVDEQPNAIRGAWSDVRRTWETLTARRRNLRSLLSAEQDSLVGAAQGQVATLEVQTDAGLHGKIAVQGIDLIAIKAHFITCSPKTINSLGASWTVLPTDDPEARTGLDPLSPPPIDTPAESPGPRRSHTVIERNLPVMYEILDDERAQAILDRTRSDRHANVLAGPKVTLLSGQHGFIADCSQSPFVVGLEDGKPQIRVIEEGLRIYLCPVFCGGYDRLKLDCRLRLSSIRDVEVFEFEQADGKPARIQIPEVETTRWEATVEMPVGRTLLIGGLKKRDEDGEPQPMLVMLRADKMASKQMAAGEPKMHSRVYNVGDLVVEVGHVVIPASYDKAPALASAEVSVDFDPLVELITTTVAPDTWEGVGGPGSIRPFPTTLSLLVEQTEQVHEQIVDLLEQLRRVRDVQILLETEIVRTPDGVLRRLGYHFVSGDYAPLTPDQARMLRRGIQVSEHASARRLPKAALFNGQIAQVAISTETDEPSEGAGNLSLQAVMSNDRRSVRLTFALEKEAAGSPRTALVQDGHSLLVDVTDLLPGADRHVGVPVAPGSRMFRRVPSEPSTERTLVLVTPRIVIQEEEEEQLGIIGTP